MYSYRHEQLGDRAFQILLSSLNLFFCIEENRFENIIDLVFPSSKISFIRMVGLILNSEIENVNKTSGIFVLLKDSLNSYALQNLSPKPKSSSRKTFLICFTATLTQSNEQILLIASFTPTYEEYTS